MSYMRKLLGLLSRKEKRKLLLVLFGVLVLGILELAGIGSILPFLSVASKPEMIQTNILLNRAYEILGFRSEESFLFALGIGVVLFILIRNAMKVLVIYMNTRYTAMRMNPTIAPIITVKAGSNFVSKAFIVLSISLSRKSAPLFSIVANSPTSSPEMANCVIIGGKRSCFFKDDPTGLPA